MTVAPGRGSSGGSRLEARILSESDFPAWREFVDHAPAGSIYSYPEYLEALCEAVGGDFRILAVFKGDEIVGGIGLYETRPGGFRVLGNRLLLYYNGLVVKEYSSKYPSENTSRHVAILGMVADTLATRGYHKAVLHNRHPVQDVRPFLARGWKGSQNYSYILRFEDPEGAFLRIEKNQRRLIKRCQDYGISLTRDDDFPSFYGMHRETSQRKGIPVYMPEVRFERFFSRLASQDLARLYHARLGTGQSVASQLVLLSGHPITHTVTAAADEDYLSQGTNPFLRWKTCEALAAEGFVGNDLTDAALNPVTRFKSQLGGMLVANQVLSTRGTLPFRVHRKGLQTLRRTRGLARAALRRLGLPRLKGRKDA
ncbi:MAG: GNAT family N-acetyltransferase [Gemmatimonadota bacterium]|jgi:hypothetical protein